MTRIARWAALTTQDLIVCLRHHSRSVKQDASITPNTVTHLNGVFSFHASTTSQNGWKAVVRADLALGVRSVLRKHLPKSLLDKLEDAGISLEDAIIGGFIALNGNGEARGTANSDYRAGYYEAHDLTSRSGFGKTETYSVKAGTIFLPTADADGTLRISFEVWKSRRFTSESMDVITAPTAAVKT